MGIQLAQIYWKNQGSLAVDFYPVQRQTDGTSCGVFAVANATALCHGLDPTTLVYDEKQMRKHLLACLTTRNFDPFPVVHKNRPKAAISSQKVDLFCNCNMPASFDKEMVECEKCLKWFHFRCVALADEPQNWTCMSCMP